MGRYLYCNVTDGPNKGTDIDLNVRNNKFIETEYKLFSRVDGTAVTYEWLTDEKNKLFLYFYNKWSKEDLLEFFLFGSTSGTDLDVKSVCHDDWERYKAIDAFQEILSETCPEDTIVISYE